MIKLKFIFTILITFLLPLKMSLAQDFPSSNSKNYETKTIKKNNEIEIRLIPKNPPAKIENKQEPKDSIPLNEITENSDIKENNDPISQEIEATKEPEIIYEKKAEENNLIVDQVLEAETKNTNLNRENSLKLWREEQRRLREERIKARHEESRKKYQSLKEKSVIKQAENLDKNPKKYEASKSSMINYYNNSTSSQIIQNQNSSPASTNTNIVNSNTPTALEPAKPMSNAPTPSNQISR